MQYPHAIKQTDRHFTKNLDHWEEKYMPIPLQNSHLEVEWV